MKVVSYLKSVPSLNSNVQKEQLLIKFVQGVNTGTDTGILHKNSNLLDCDVAVIQGWVHAHIDSQHLRLRKNVIQHQLSCKKYVCVADANLFLYADLKNTHEYLRYSFNGVFPDTGIYFDNNPDPSRWHQVSKDLNIGIASQKVSGNHILICLQRNGGWSMGNVSIIDWIIDVIKKIRHYSDRRILIRTHPGDKKAITSYVPKLRKRFKDDASIDIIVGNRPLIHDLNNAWAVVNHNSSSIVGPIIMGYPAFVTDPIRSQCAEVANVDFSTLENPQEFDRKKWAERLAMFHWKFSELEDGTAWQHMKSYVRQ